MTEAEQRIAIAEFCGWKCVEPSPKVKDSPYARWMCEEDLREFRNIPNYLHDLNAMHEAESRLEGMTIDTKSLYLDYLALMHAELFEKKRDGLKRDPFDREWAVFRSTAVQRAEALLRTIGKWKE